MRGQSGVGCNLHAFVCVAEMSTVMLLLEYAVYVCVCVCMYACMYKIGRAHV